VKLLDWLDIKYKIEILGPTNTNTHDKYATEHLKTKTENAHVMAQDVRRQASLPRMCLCDFWRHVCLNLSTANYMYTITVVCLSVVQMTSQKQERGQSPLGYF